MFGLLDRCPNLWAYVDDAHGFGWAGRFGAGVVLGERELHDRMFVVMGLAKALAASGAFIVCPTPELADRIFCSGSTMIFSGPILPAGLGAAIAGARILLSDELPSLQARLAERVTCFAEAATRRGLDVSTGPTPLKYVMIGAPDAAIAACRRVLDDGFLTNVAVYPAVPLKGAGIRVLFNVHQTTGRRARRRGQHRLGARPLSDGALLVASAWTSAPSSTENRTELLPERPPSRLRMGRVSELEHLYRSNWRFVRELLQALGVGAKDLDDLSHEIFLVASRKLPEARMEVAAEHRWLRRITQYVVLGYRRRAFRRLELRSTELDELASVPAMEAALSEREDTDLLHVALSRLDPHDADVLALHTVGQLSFRTLAEISDCDPKTARAKVPASTRACPRSPERPELQLVAHAGGRYSLGVSAARGRHRKRHGRSNRS